MAEKTDLKTLMDQGARLYAAGHTAAAAAVYREALALAPDDPTVRLRHATAIWHGEQRAEEALAEVQALARKHGQAVIYATEGLILNSMGRFEDAVKAAENALKADPGHTPAWLDLATSATPETAPALVEKLKAAMDRPGLSQANRRDMHFAMAGILRKLGCFDEAFDHTEQANAATDVKWSAEGEAPLQAELRQVFSPEIMTRLRGAGHADGRMIFILGMPRSGTTLLERMLLAHPDIASAGETTTIGRVFLQLRQQCGNDPAMLAKNLTPANLQAMAKAYLEDVAGRLGAAQPYRIIDKMPANYLFVPAIRLMLPRATIVHLERHPLDTGLSCYEASFAFGLDYAARLETLGQAYRMYADLIDDWHGLPGIRMHPMRYEDLVRQPEAEMRSLLDACALDWHPACLQPAGEGMIKTASVEQARAAVNTRSIGRWRAFQARLAPMIDAMGGADWAEARATQPRTAAD
ncbi:MAG: sulfotransferase [Pseudomonadota bacterium]